MTYDDFHEIKYISAKEITDTGAQVKDVRLDLIRKLSKLREMAKHPIHFQVNGLTTGTHKSKEHPDGIAADCWFDGVKTWYEAKRIAIMAWVVGFKCVAVYWNGTMYSYHFDLGEYRDWTGNKLKGEEAWTYGILINDPKQGAVI